MFYVCEWAPLKRVCVKARGVVVGWLLPKSETRLHWNSIRTPVLISPLIGVFLVRLNRFSFSTCFSPAQWPLLKDTACGLRLSATEPSKHFKVPCIWIINLFIYQGNVSISALSVGFAYFFLPSLLVYPDVCPASGFHLRSALWRGALDGRPMNQHRQLTSLDYHSITNRYPPASEFK